MKLKILVILIFFLMISNILVIANSQIKTLNDDDNKVIEVNIAMLSSTPIGWDKDAATYYLPILEDYEWTVGKKTYKFVITQIGDKDITNGNLNVDNFDAMLVPGGGVGDEEAIIKGTLPNVRPNVIRWKKGIADFIKDGGGYIGYCGGTTMLCDLDKKPETTLEKNMHKCTIGVSEVKCHFKNVGNYFFTHFRKDGYKLVGNSFYMHWSSYVDHDKGWPTLNGVCFDVKINRSNPVYDDYLEDTCRARWIGGPSIVLPTNGKSKCSVGAWYPEEPLCENESMRVHHWKYTGGVLGHIKGLINAIKWCRERGRSLSEAIIASIDFAEGWEKLDSYVDINDSNKPCFVQEIYPNENGGRISLNAFHVARNVWWGGHIEEHEDIEDDYIANDFFQLVDYIPFNETVEDERTYTWWIVRREIAWAAKVPDNDLPPIYGPSQVSDIYPYNQSNNFTIIGNSVVSDGIESLDLFYRYSDNNETWTSWTLYGTDLVGSDGWSWEFNAPNGIGYYEFHSIRHVRYEHECLNETAPSGADAMAYIEV